MDVTPGLDLSPRPASSRPRRRGRSLIAVAVLVIVLAAIGFLVVKSLDDASLYFLNADEAVAQRDSLGDDRFRLQGTVVDGSVREESDGVRFVVAFDGAEVDVAHQGDPPELFQPDIPVVLEGRWQGEVFSSDRIMIRHSSEYEAENQDRLREADQGSGNR